MKQALISAAVVCASALVCNLAQAQLVEEVLLNGDFEIIEVDEMSMPVLDDYGNEVPIDWFRSGGGDPPPGGTPKTELVADDSEPPGTRAAALNPPPSGQWPAGQDAWSDWRSADFPTTPGETLRVSFDFKFLDIVTLPQFQEYRFDLRSFSDDAGTDFVTESLLYVSPVGYRYDFQDNDPGTGTQTMTVTENFNDEQWHTIEVDWVVPGVVNGAARDGNFSDVRFSINAFTTLIEGQVRFDNISVTRPIDTPLGDYNQNGIVDAADYTVWRDTLGSTTDLRANGDDTGPSMNVVDQADYNLWKTNFGDGATGAVAGLGASAVPEPSSAMLLATIAGFITTIAVRGRRK